MKETPKVQAAADSSTAPSWRALRLLPPGMAVVLNNPIYRALSGIGRNREEVLNWAGVKPGLDLLELGPGGGYYTAALAERVGPESKVYSVDIQAEMIAKVKANIERKGVTNVVPLVADGAVLPLADESVDFVFALYVFEEIIDLTATISQLNRVLRQGGTLAIAQVAYDFKQDQKEAMRHHIPLGGFTLIDESDGRWTYRVRYRKS